jgi:DNA-binding transcriptional regulator LsrR (DeoR family)
MDSPAVENLRQAGARYMKARAELDAADAARTQAIKQAHADSMTVRQIAEVLGVSHQLVGRLVNRDG